MKKGNWLTTAPRINSHVLVIQIQLHYVLEWTEWILYKTKPE